LLRSPSSQIVVNLQCNDVQQKINSTKPIPTGFGNLSKFEEKQNLESPFSVRLFPSSFSHEKQIAWTTPPCGAGPACQNARSLFSVLSRSEFFRKVTHFAPKRPDGE
jgi:hypothetical protein